MSENITGVVEFIGNRNGIYSVKVGGEWYGFYKTAPRCAKGDTVFFEFKMNGKYMNADPKTLEVLTKAKVQEAPAQKQVAGVDWDTRQRSIEFQAARNSALAFVEIVTKTEAVKLPAKQADKYDALMSLVDEVTGKFFNDTQQVVLGNYPQDNEEASQEEEEEGDD